MKSWLDLVQVLLTITAVLAAGFWFVEQQSLKPQIKLDQSISQRPAEGEPGMILILVDVRATNVGKVKVSLKAGHLWLKQINPVPGKDLTEDTMRDLELDPGEADQSFFTTYLIPDEIRTVQLTSRYSVPNKANYYWQLETATDLKPNPRANSTASVPK